jgi:hypothetical protein
MRVLQSVSVVNLTARRAGRGFRKTGFLRTVAACRRAAWWAVNSYAARLVGGICALPLANYLPPPTRAARTKPRGETMDIKKKTNAEHDKRTYRKFILRIRRDSELLREMERHAKEGKVSINFLTVSTLCDFFGVPLAHREYTITERRKIL